MFFLSHEGTRDIFSGYGLNTAVGRKDRLVGLLMVDRPKPADPTWLTQVGEIYGSYDLVPMTATGERGLVCGVRVTKDSLPLVRFLPHPQGRELATAIKPLLEVPPNPVLKVSWSQDQSAWQSSFWIGLPPVLEEVFDRTGNGSIAVELPDYISFVTRAPLPDIAGFRGAPVTYQWEYYELPTAPLIRFKAEILDDPVNPFLFEHFLNINDRSQVHCLSRLVQQGEIVFDYFDEASEYVFSKHLPHTEEMRQTLHQIVGKAITYSGNIPPRLQNFNKAKAEFQRQSPL